MTQVLAAELTWTGARFERGLQVVVDDKGRVEEVDAGEDEPTRRLSGRALVPGFVDAHSHAFQRGLRGRGESFPAGAGSFWTWREAMYQLVGELDADRLHALSLKAFREMLAAGITSVGEFHYLHHGPSGEGWELDEAVIEAAREAGIRLVLLQAFYQTGGIGRPLEGAQLRFQTRDPDEYWERFDALDELLDPTLQTLGAVVHSVRAASPEDLEAVHREAHRRGLVFHMHVEEQRVEIEECRRAYGATPLGMVNARLEVDERFTAVHATHSSPEDLGPFLALGGNVCVCPLTEANLADGVCDLPTIRAAGGNVALGTDSNARISMLEEMRWLEYAQRLAQEERGILRDEDGEVAPVLLAAATAGGARSLGLEAGSIRPGMHADLVAIDLSAPSLSGWTPETLPVALVLGAGDEVVAEVCVGGRWVRD